MTTETAESKKPVILVTRGIDHELSSDAFTIANGGITAGQEVSIFLTSCGVDLVRRRGAEMTRVDRWTPSLSSSPTSRRAAARSGPAPHASGRVATSRPTSSTAS